MKKTTLLTGTALCMLWAAGCSSPAEPPQTPADSNMVLITMAEGPVPDTSAATAGQTPTKHISSHQKGLEYEIDYHPSDTADSPHSDQEVADAMNAVLKVVAATVKSGKWDTAQTGDTAATQNP